MADDKLPTYGEILDRLVRLEGVVNNLVRYICGLEEGAERMLEETVEMREVLHKHGITPPLDKPKPPQ